MTLGFLFTLVAIIWLVKDFVELLVFNWKYIEISQIKCYSSPDFCKFCIKSVSSKRLCSLRRKIIYPRTFSSSKISWSHDNQYPWKWKTSKWALSFFFTVSFGSKARFTTKPLLSYASPKASPMHPVNTSRSCQCICVCVRSSRIERRRIIEFSNNSSSCFDTIRLPSLVFQHCHYSC